MNIQQYIEGRLKNDIVFRYLYCSFLQSQGEIFDSGNTFEWKIIAQTLSFQWEDMVSEDVSELQLASIYGLFVIRLSESILFQIKLAHNA